MRNKTYFIEPLWKNNQILVAILGICSALAVTVKVKIAVTMALSVIFVTGASCFFVSLVRHITPANVRMIAQLAIISTFVIMVDQFLKAYFYEMSKTLSVFVGLIITNCIVMGRTESMAKNVAPIPALLDGISAGMGYGYVIVIVGGLREIFGFGTFFDIQIIPQAFYATPEHLSRYVNIGLMPLAPAAFFILGGLIWIKNIIDERG